MVQVLDPMFVNGTRTKFEVINLKACLCLTVFSFQLELSITLFFSLERFNLALRLQNWNKLKYGINGAIFYSTV